MGLQDFGGKTSASDNSPVLFSSLTFIEKKPKTYIRLTPKGEKALLSYLDELSRLMKKDAH